MQFRLTPLAAALLVAFSSSALAQEAAAIQSRQSDNIDTPALTVGRVTVVGRASGPLAARNVLTSVDMLREDQIAEQAVAHNWQLFGQIPGVMLTQFGQGTTSGKFSMRGFNGEGEIIAVKLLIDGIPSNSNDGNMPYIDLAPLLDIRAVEVVRGTNDSRYGMDNIAGNANLVTKIGDNYAKGRLGYGSFGSRDVQGALGIDANGWSQNYAVSYQNADGHREHSGLEKAGLSGKWFWSPDKGASRYGLIVRHHRAVADEAGYLTLARSRSAPELSPAHGRTDRDRRRMDQVALQADHEFSPSLFWSTQLYQNALPALRHVFQHGVATGAGCRRTPSRRVLQPDLAPGRHADRQLHRHRRDRHRTPGQPQRTLQHSQAGTPRADPQPAVRPEYHRRLRAGGVQAECRPDRDAGVSRR